MKHVKKIFSNGSIKNVRLTEKKQIPGSFSSKLLDEMIRFKYARSIRQAKNSKLFFSIGLCLSLLFVITAFEWKFYDSGELISLGSLNPEFDNVIEIPPTEQPPPPPQKIEHPQIIEVPDEEEIVTELEIDLDVEITEEQAIKEQVFDNIDLGETEEEKADEIFTIVEQQPQPVGGIQAFYQYVSKNLIYPSQAKRADIEGRVYIEFVVEKDGSLTDVRAIKGIGGGCDEEAVRIISQAPAWIPGKQRGRPVRVKMVLPILFRLES